MMSHLRSFGFLILLTLGNLADAQPLHRPTLPEPPSVANQREARRLYGVGLLYERRNRLLEALRALEEAAKLDPTSVSVARALVPLYVGLDRLDDAVAKAEHILDAEPDDYQTASLIARQLRAVRRNREAVKFFERALRSEKLADLPHVATPLWYDLADLHHSAKNHKQAEAAYRQVVSRMADPRVIAEATGAAVEDVRSQAAEVCERLGRVLLEQKKLDEAREAFAQARKWDGSRANRIAFDLARVYRDAGRERDALEQLDLYLKAQPSGLEAYQMRIDLQRKLGHDPLPDLKTASDQDINNLPLRLLLAQELAQAGQLAKAALLYEELAKSSTDVAIYRGMCELYAKDLVSGPRKLLARLNHAISAAVGKDEDIGDANQAAHARSMLQALREQPELVRAMLRLAVSPASGRLDYTTRITLGTLAARVHDLATAEKLYRSAMEGRAEALGASESELYSGLLQVLQLAHKNAEVVALADQGLAKAQNTNRVLFHRAKAYAYLGLNKPEEALKAANEAVTDSGKAQMLGSRKMRAYILGEIGRANEAIEDCLALVKEFPEGSELRDARLALSRAYQAAGHFEESEAELERILALDPNDATVNNDLGYGLADRGRELERAEKLVRKALELDRQQRVSGTELGIDSDLPNAAYLDSLGWVLFRRGKYAEALRILEQAVSLPQGNDPVLWDHLGDTYARLKQTEKARQAWTKAVTLYQLGVRYPREPRHKEIQEKLRATPLP
jgi:tetratricopeptide (TPR) repeat protein